MPSNSFALAIPAADAADLNLALAVLQNEPGSAQVAVAAFRQGIISHRVGHLWDPVSAQYPEGEYYTTWRGLPQPAEGWPAHGLSNNRVNQLRQRLLASRRTYDSGLPTGEEHVRDLCTANGILMMGMMPLLPLGPLAAGAHYVWLAGNRPRHVVYVLTAHTRTEDSDPTADARFLTTPV